MNPTLGQKLLRWTVLTLGFAFLYLPILLLVVYSFNSSRLATVWAGFSVKWYGELLRDRQILEAAWVSLRIAFWTASAATVIAPHDQPLFDALRAWRRDEAARQHLPPYVIFHDRTLAEIAAKKPAGLPSLAAISGVGEGKLERYGEAVLEVLNAATV